MTDTLVSAPAATLTDKLVAARAASRRLATATSAQKDAALRAIADAVMRSESRILPAIRLVLYNG